MTKFNYQQEVNNLTGALGPEETAYWDKVGQIVGNTADLSAHPLFYNPPRSEYVSASDQSSTWKSYFLDKNTLGFGRSKRKKTSKSKNKKNQKKQKKRKNQKKQKKNMSMKKT